MGKTTFRLSAINQAMSKSLNEVLVRAAAEAGYRRCSILSEDGPANGATVVFCSDSLSRPKVDRWPDSDYEQQAGDTIFVRIGRETGDRLLSIIAAIFIGESGFADSIELSVPVGERTAYSEDDREALLRALTVVEALSQSSLVGRVEVIGELGETRVELPTAEGHWALPLPLETSRKRATREFIRWATRVFGPIAFRESDVLMEVPVLAVQGVEGKVNLRVPYNLINGSLLPIQSEHDQTTRTLLDIEMPFLRRCWRFDSGLKDVEAEYGQPTGRLGGYDPTGTGLSSLEMVKDQWFYTNLQDGYAVIFREYEDRRIGINLLEIV
jgi:hypothetical protein